MLESKRRQQRKGESTEWWEATRQVSFHKGHLFSHGPKLRSLSQSDFEMQPTSLLQDSSFARNTIPDSSDRILVILVRCYSCELCCKQRALFLDVEVASASAGYSMLAPLSFSS